MRSLGRGIIGIVAGIGNVLRSYWSLAFLSIGLSTALWVAVSDIENPPRTDTIREIPIEAVNVPDGLAISGGTSLGTASIRVTAREDAWDDLGASDFRAVADFAGTPQGEQDVPVKVTLVGGNPADITMGASTPLTITARLEVRQTRSVPVRVNITGQPPIGFETERPVISVEAVNVSGPEALVQQVAFVEADVNLSGATVNVQQSFQLIPRSASSVTIDGVTLDPAQAEVSIAVTQTIFNRSVGVEPSVVGRVAEGYRIAGITVDPPTVVVFGTQEALQSLTIVPTDDIDVSGAESDVTRTVPLHLTPDVSAPGQPTVVVEVSVVPSKGETEYGVLPRVVNLAPEFNVTINTPTLRIRLTGDLPVLDALGFGDIRATVDASGLDPGVYRLTPVVEVPPNVQVEEFSPREVIITVTRR